jgi:integrase
MAKQKLKEPTIGELYDAYPEIAEMERLRNDRPGKRTVMNVRNGVKQVCAFLEWTENHPSDDWSQCDKKNLNWKGRPFSWLRRGRLDRFLMLSKKAGISPLSAWSYLSALRGLTAKWCASYYLERGWKVPAAPLPICRRRAPRYVRPERETLLKVKAWYESLWAQEDKRLWLAATMMLEFAMRNGDVERLRWSNFRPRHGTETPAADTVLCYTPHKTELSSGRTVAWPVHPDVWTRLTAVRESTGLREGTHFQGLVVPAARQVFSAINADIRSRRFFAGGKAAYELRKICIDHIYQRFGAEMASSISGDDIRTITRYYADPSAVNAGAVRVMDLL